MTPAAIISAVKDVLILAALVFLIYLLVSYGKDVVKIADMATVEKQIEANNQTVADWRQEQVNAEAKHTEELQQVTAAINAQRAPVYILRPSPAAPGPGTVPINPASPGGQSAASGSVDSGRGVDLRPAINAFELKYETALSDCRAALAQWPIIPK